ncbi:hypothetical protein HDU96_003912 [Phlyctochytrium bullatum]|nr:hypothetical protein HDU96_003912 [Phlyctochytrium bullatum]
MAMDTTEGVGGPTAFDVLTPLRMKRPRGRPKGSGKKAQQQHPFQQQQQQAALHALRMAASSQDPAALGLLASRLASAMAIASPSSPGSAPPSQFGHRPHSSSPMPTAGANPPVAAAEAPASQTVPPKGKASRLSRVAKAAAAAEAKSQAAVSKGSAQHQSVAKSKVFRMGTALGPQRQNSPSAVAPAAGPVGQDGHGMLKASGGAHDGMTDGPSARPVLSPIPVGFVTDGATHFATDTGPPTKKAHGQGFIQESRTPIPAAEPPKPQPRSVAPKSKRGGKGGAAAPRKDLSRLKDAPKIPASTVLSVPVAVPTATMCATEAVPPPVSEPVPQESVAHLAPTSTNAVSVTDVSTQSGATFEPETIPNSDFIHSLPRPSTQESIANTVASAAQPSPSPAPSTVVTPVLEPSPFPSLSTNTPSPTPVPVQHSDPLFQEMSPMRFKPAGSTPRPIIPRANPVELASAIPGPFNRPAPPKVSTAIASNPTLGPAFPSPTYDIFPLQPMDLDDTTFPYYAAPVHAPLPSPGGLFQPPTSFAPSWPSSLGLTSGAPGGRSAKRGGRRITRGVPGVATFFPSLDDGKNDFLQDLLFDMNQWLDLPDTLSEVEDEDGAQLRVKNPAPKNPSHRVPNLGKMERLAQSSESGFRCGEAVPETGGAVGGSVILGLALLGRSAAAAKEKQRGLFFLLFPSLWKGDLDAAAACNAQSNKGLRVEEIPLVSQAGNDPVSGNSAWNSDGPRARFQVTKTPRYRVQMAHRDACCTPSA